MKPTLKSKDDVQKAFLQLLEVHRKSKTHILTKEEQAQQAQNQKLVETVAAFTPQNIVKGLAELQLDLGKTIEKLSERLSSELKKLGDMRSALQVQEANLKATLDAKVAANALYILKQEQTQREQTLNEEHNTATLKLDKETTDRRTEWTKEQADFESKEAEFKANLDKNRSKELEEYRYTLARKYKIEQDDFDTRKKLLERELIEKQREKDKNWADREKVLATNQAEFEKYKLKVDNFDKELEEKTKDAREKAIKQTTRECNESMALLEKEVAGRQRVAELQIQNLEALIESQKFEIEKLTAELKEALGQVQQLSLKALEGKK